MWKYSYDEYIHNFSNCKSFTKLADQISNKFSKINKVRKSDKEE